jgi:D-3-phosphoglycerate dehydrogenase / 2-oxoglutarate reductase
MRIVIADDYQDAVRSLDCFSKIAGHQVSVYHDSVKDINTLASRFREAEALVLIRERTAITEPLLRLLPSLNLLAFVAGNPTNVINSEVLEHPQVRDFIQQGSQD